MSTLTPPSPMAPAAFTPALPLAPQGVQNRTLAGTPLSLFPIALGANAFGWSADALQTGKILDEFVELGGNLVDATGSHADGRSEVAVGRWLASRGERGRVVLGTTVGGHHDLSDGAASVVTHAVEAALSRLGTEYLDLLSLQLGASTPIDEALIAVDDLVRSGKVRFVAAAAPTSDQMVEARVASAQHGLSPIVAVQMRYSLALRTEYEAGLDRVVAQQGCGLMPRQPLAGGFLSGKYRTRDQLGRLARRGEAAAHLNRRGTGILSVLDSIASEHGVANSSVALAWLLTKRNVVAPIVSVSEPRQLADLAASVRVQLTRHQVADLDRVSR